MVTGRFIQLIIQYFYTQNLQITFVQLHRKLHTVQIPNLIAHSGAVVETLRSKPECRGFDS